MCGRELSIKVTLIAAPEFMHKFKGTGTNAESLIEFCGRICYNSFGERAHRSSPEYFENILSSGHGSILEHANYTFLVEDVSRCLTHELVRHRAGFAFSQESTRYVRYDYDHKVVELDNFTNTEQKKIKEHTKATIKLYKELMEKEGRKKDVTTEARRILPQNLATKIVFTANVRALRHFICLRGTEHADPEIRFLAIELLFIMEQELPLVFEDIKIIDGFVTCRHKKV